jgi:CRISPR/Cas system CSM-associated protein Csm3 (group 7 of RAMP superfamily)
MGNRNGVGIHRGTRTAKNKALYDFEVVPAGASFDFEMTLENSSDVETGAVLVGIKALQRGDLQVGGGTSRGLGGVRLAEWQVRRLTPDNLGAYLFEDQKGETVEENALRSQYYAAFQQAIEA